MIRYQLIVGMNGPIDINHNAIHEAMKIFKIKKRQKCFEKLLILSQWWIGKLSKESINES